MGLGWIKERAGSFFRAGWASTRGVAGSGGGEPGSRRSANGPAPATAPPALAFWVIVVVIREGSTRLGLAAELFEPRAMALLDERDVLCWVEMNHAIKTTAEMFRFGGSGLDLYAV